MIDKVWDHKKIALEIRMHPQEDPCLSSFKFTLLRIHAWDAHHTQDASNESPFSQRGELGHGRDKSKQHYLNLSSLCVKYAYDHILICISGWLPQEHGNILKRVNVGHTAVRHNPKKFCSTPRHIFTPQCLTDATGVHLHDCKTANFNPKRSKQEATNSKAQIPSQVNKINSTLNILRQMMDNT